MISKKLQKLFKQKEKLEKKRKLLQYDDFVLNIKIIREIKKCKHYDYDEDAFEEYCDCFSGQEFDRMKNCVGCRKYEVKQNE